MDRKGRIQQSRETPQDYIYDELYSKTRSGSRRKMPVNPKSFLKDLLALQAKQSGGTLSGQTSKNAIFESAWKSTKKGAKRSRDTDNLYNDYYHFNPADWQHGVSGSQIKWRVYLNPKPKDTQAGPQHSDCWPTIHSLPTLDPMSERSQP